MRCQRCNFDNPTEMRFCGQCGKPLAPSCLQCGFENPAGFAFCGKCGAPLSTPAQPVTSSRFPVVSPQSSAPNPQPPIAYTPSHLAERIRAATVTDGERKTITALFADLKGSTALIEGLDPEEARALIDPALQLMMDAVHRYEGYVAQVLGDGIFALFGAPLAHEDHPQRALYAALRMQEEMRRYSDQIRLRHGVPFVMRVGLNTGEVVLRSIRKDDLHTDYVPVGHSTNLAARMEQMATPGSILVTEHTYKLTDGYFAFKALGQTQIKGVEEPLHIYEVLGTGPLRTRLQVTATRRGLTRFVGRQSEMGQLTTALEQAKAGHGQIVGVMGEPGLGKSRLFYEFQVLSQADCLLLEAYSVSHGKASAYLPVIELLKRYFDIQPQDDERKRREKVTGKVLTLDRSLEETLPYLSTLLGIEEQPSPLAQMDPQIRRQRTLAALKKLFVRESLNQPLMLIFEDLHWIDSETQGFLDTLSEGLVSAKILLLVNYRPEYRHDWGQKTYYTQLRLAPFGNAEAEEFLGAVLGSDTRLAALRRLILEKTQGTPFFMEEMVQTLVEDGTLSGTQGNYILTRPVTSLQLPTTVQGVLAARIDRLLPEEKVLLQQLAVIGRKFSLGLIRQVIPQSEAELYHLLSALQRKEFLYEQPAFPESAYVFKHALTQEVAYGTVLHEHRKRLHERTGQAVEALYTATLQEHYSDLAHHYHRSANTAKAIEYLYLAGRQELQRSAHTEAIDNLIVTLDLLRAQPDTPERASQELRVRLTLGPAVMAVQGIGASAVGEHYARARALCAQLGDASQRVQVLYGLWLFHLGQGELRTAQALADECLDVAKQVDEAEVLIPAYQTVGTTYLLRGELVRGLEAHAQSLALYQPQHHALTSLYGGRNLQTAALYNSAMALWLLGYPEQARTRNAEALHIAHELGHPLTLANVLTMNTWVNLERGEWRITQERAEAALALARDHGFSVFVKWNTMTMGVVLLAQGQWAESIAQIKHSLEANPGALQQTRWLTWLAEGYRGAGQVDQGLAVVAEALARVEKNDERFNEAEVYRLKGELTLQQGSNEQGATSREQEAEACFLKAIAIAQKQSAKSLELRAVMSLVRLRQAQARRAASRTTHHATRITLAEAHQMLAEVYYWFTEGFDTKDLQEAKALLERLEPR